MTMTTIKEPWFRTMTLSEAVASVWAVALMLCGILLYGICLVGCAPSVRFDAEEMQDVGGADPRAYEPTPDAAAPSPRIRLAIDPGTGRNVLWDAKAHAVCERQPLCGDCSIPWDDNPHYCLPTGSWAGKPSALTPFALGAWYADPFCSIRLYGLNQYAQRAGANPIWAYDFHEARRSARVFLIREASSADVARPFRVELYNPNSTCERVPDQDLRTATLNFRLYIQVQEYPAEEWVPWSEAKTIVGGSP